PATSSAATPVPPSISATSSLTAFTQLSQVSPVSPWVVVLLSGLLARCRRPQAIPREGMRGPWWPRLVHRSCTELPAPLHSKRPGGGGGPRSMATMVDPSVSRSSRSDPRLLALAEESGYEVQGRIRSEEHTSAL